MLSCRSVAVLENAEKEVVMSDSVIGRIEDVVARLNRFKKPITVVVRDQAYHHV